MALHKYKLTYMVLDNYMKTAEYVDHEEAAYTAEDAITQGRVNFVENRFGTSRLLDAQAEVVDLRRGGHTIRLERIRVLKEGITKEDLEEIVR